MNPTRTLSVAAAFAALLLASEASAQRQVNVRQNAAPSGTVEIQMNDGSLRVVGWGRSEVQVTGTLSRDGDRVDLDGGGSDTEVRVAGQRGRAGPANLEVRVPAGSSVEVTTGGAPLIINGVNGDVEATSRGGVITVQGSPRTVEAASQHGGITVDARTDRVNLTAISGPVRVSGAVRQRAEINSVSGAVIVAADVGEAEINAVNGAVRVANVTGGRVEVNSVSGSVHVNGSRLRGNVSSLSGGVVISGSVGGALNVESHAGSVELRLPASTGAEVQVTSWSGGVQSDWRLRRDGGEWRGTLGRGGPAVNVTTFSGSVKITRQ